MSGITRPWHPHAATRTISQDASCLYRPRDAPFRDTLAGPRTPWRRFFRPRRNPRSSRRTGHRCDRTNSGCSMERRLMLGGVVHCAWPRTASGLDRTRLSLTHARCQANSRLVRRLDCCRPYADRPAHLFNHSLPRSPGCCFFLVFIKRADVLRATSRGIVAGASGTLGRRDRGGSPGEPGPI